MRLSNRRPMPLAWLILSLGCGAGARFPESEIASARIAETAAAFAAEAPPPQIHETRVRRTSSDRAGDVHVVLDAYRNGHRIPGAERIRHALADGTVRTQSFTDTSRVLFEDAPLAVDEARALAAASAALGDLKARVTKTASELIYERAGDVYRLVYVVDVSLDPREPVDPGWLVRVDAASGQVLSRADVTRHDGIGRSYYYGTVPLKTTFNPAYGYTLEDHDRPAPGQRTVTASDIDAALVPAPPGGYFQFNDIDNVWGNGIETDLTVDPARGPFSAWGETPAVDAHHSAAWAWDVYTEVFGRYGPYGNGNGVTLLVNGSSPYNLDGPSYRDGIIWINPFSGSCVPGADLRAIGHEFGHAFLQSLVSPNNVYTGETGGVDEGNSDILGKLTEIYGLSAMGLPPGVTTLTLPATVTPAPRGLPASWNDWLIRSCNQNIVKRFMNRPSLDGVSYDYTSPDIEALHVDPHRSSGPINRMFYFLAQGVAATMMGGETSIFLPQGLTGIGVPAAADVYYRGVNGYLAPSNPKYADLRFALEQAAGTDTTVLKAVRDAFAAVGIGPPADRTGPAISNITSLTAPGATMSATVADTSGVKMVEYGQGRLLWGIARAAPWSILTPASVTSGKTTVRVCATDMLDNMNCADATVIVDASAPLISLFQVTNPYVAASKTVHLVATDRAISRVAIFLDGTKQLYNHSYLLTGAVPSIDLSLTLPMPAGITEGTHTLEARVTDGFGQAETRTVTFLWDVSPPNHCSFPNVQPGYPADGSISAVVSDAISGLARWVISFDGGGASVPGLGNRPGMDVTQGIIWQHAAVGVHYAAITCTDNFGLVSSQTVPINVVNPPHGYIGWWGQSAMPTRSASYELTAADPNGLGQVTTYVNCGTSGMHDIASSFAGNPTSYQNRFTAGGLILGETCTIWFGAADRWGIAMPVQSFAFIVQDPVTPPPVYTCDTTVNSGGNTAATFIINVGLTHGTFDFTRDTEAVPDYMEVSCAGTGTVNGLPSTNAGCETTGVGVSFTNAVSFNCSTSQIKVAVSPDCAHLGDTVWAFKLGCAH